MCWLWSDTNGVPSFTTRNQFYKIYLEKFEDPSGSAARTEPHFSSLDWRLDVHLGSRASKQAPAAKYLLKLSIQDREAIKGERLFRPILLSRSFSSPRVAPKLK